MCLVYWCVCVCVLWTEEDEKTRESDGRMRIKVRVKCVRFGQMMLNDRPHKKGAHAHGHEEPRLYGLSCDPLDSEARHN